MDAKDFFHVGDDDIEWWNSYTKMYIQEIFSVNPKIRMAAFFFRPMNMEVASFYNSCSIQMLQMITHVQMSLLNECCQAYYKKGRRPCQCFFKIEPRVICQVVEPLIEVMKDLKEYKIDLVLDVNLLSEGYFDNDIKKSLLKISDSGFKICLGGYDWRNNDKGSFSIPSEIIDFIRLGPPPSNLAEVNHFVDTSFYIRENYNVKIVVDRVQSRGELDVVCRTPYYAAMGNYLSSAQLFKGVEAIEFKAMS